MSEVQSAPVEAAAPAASAASGNVQNPSHPGSMDEALSEMDKVLGLVASFTAQMTERNATQPPQQQHLNLIAHVQEIVTLLADQSAAATALLKAARQQQLRFEEQQKQVHDMKLLLAQAAVQLDSQPAALIAAQEEVKRLEAKTQELEAARQAAQDQLDHREAALQQQQADLEHVKTELEEEKEAHAAELFALQRHIEQQTAVLQKLQLAAGRGSKQLALSDQPSSLVRHGSGSRRGARAATRDHAPAPAPAPVHTSTQAAAPPAAGLAGPDAATAAGASPGAGASGPAQPPEHRAAEHTGVQPAAARPRSECGIGWVGPAVAAGMVPAVSAASAELPPAVGAGTGTDDGEDADQMDEDEDGNEGAPAAGNELHGHLPAGGGAPGSSSRPQGPLKFHIQSISWEQVQSLFHLQRDEAAQKLGIASSTLKRICREHGIERWPFRKLQSIEVMLKEVEARAAEDPRSAGELLAELRSYKEAVYNDPDVKFDDRILQERTRLFKKRYAERQASGATGRASKRAKGGPSAAAAGGDDAGAEEEWPKWDADAAGAWGLPGGLPAGLASALGLALNGEGLAGTSGGEGLEQPAAGAGAGARWEVNGPGLVPEPDGAITVPAVPVTADGLEAPGAAASRDGPAAMDVTEDELIAHEVLAMMGQHQNAGPLQSQGSLQSQQHPQQLMSPQALSAVAGAGRPTSPFFNNAQAGRPPRSPRGGASSRLARAHRAAVAVAEHVWGLDEEPAAGTRATAVGLLRAPEGQQPLQAPQQQLQLLGQSSGEQQLNGAGKEEEGDGSQQEGATDALGLIADVATQADAAAHEENDGVAGNNGAKEDLAGAQLAQQSQPMEHSQPTQQSPATAAAPASAAAGAALEGDRHAEQEPPGPSQPQPSQEAAEEEDAAGHLPIDLSAAHSLTQLAALAAGPAANMPLPHLPGMPLPSGGAAALPLPLPLPVPLPFVAGPAVGAAGGPLGPGGILGPAGLGIAGLPAGGEEEVGASGGGRRSGRRGSQVRGSQAEELERLKRVFHLPVGQAAQELGMGLTAFKKYCRQRFNISRWPYRKVQSIESVLSAQVAAGAPQEVLDMLKRQMQAVYDNPEEELCEEFMRMRRQHHKAQWRQRRDGGEGGPGLDMLFDDKDGSGNEDSE